MNKSFNWRVFVSFGLFLSFFMILVSGVILYIGPSGRGPKATGWHIIGLTKSEWQNQHIIFGLAFSLISLFHLFISNWKVFFSYLNTQTTGGLKNTGELFVIIILFFLFSFGTYFNVQPFSGILEFGKSISKSWEGKTTQPPDSQQRGSTKLNGVDGRVTPLRPL